MYRWILSALLLSATSAVLAQDAAKGENLFKANNCIQCHGPNGQGVADQKGPRIGGQHDWYVLKALSDFKKRERNNPEMYPYIRNLSEQDYKDLSAYVSQLSGQD